VSLPNDAPIATLSASASIVGDTVIGAIGW
jgi:hypothetical protein